MATGGFDSGIDLLLLVVFGLELARPNRDIRLGVLDFLFNLFPVAGRGISWNTDVTTGSGGGGTLLKKSAKLSS